MCGAWMTVHTQRLASRSAEQGGRGVSAGKEGENGQSSYCVSRRRMRIRPSVTSGREPFGPVKGWGWVQACLRDRYRLGHLSVVLLLSAHVGRLNVQSGHGKCPIPSDVSHASCDRASVKSGVREAGGHVYSRWYSRGTSGVPLSSRVTWRVIDGRKRWNRGTYATRLVAYWPAKGARVERCLALVAPLTKGRPKNISGLCFS